MNMPYRPCFLTMTVEVFLFFFSRVGVQVQRRVRNSARSNSDPKDRSVLRVFALSPREHFNSAPFAMHRIRLQAS